MAGPAQWTGSDARLLRQALRMSLRAFAAHLGMGERTVSKWERGGLATSPRPDSQAILDTALAQAPDAARRRFELLLNQRERRLNNASQAAHSEAVSPLDRRSALRSGLAAALPVATLTDVSAHLAKAFEDAERYFDGAVVGQLQHQLDTCKSADGQLDQGKQLPIVLALLDCVERHVLQVRPTVRRSLLSFGADCAEFAGWLYRDSRDMAHSLYWHDRAVEWAQAADDLPMQGYVLLRKAQLAYDEREPSRMFILAEAVQRPRWRVPLKVRAEAIQQEARADAMLGASTATVRTKLGRARDLLADADRRSPDDSPLGRHYSPSLLDMQAAICLTEAGRPRQAVALYERSLAERQFSPRDYGFFQAQMAASLALSGEPDDAATVAMAAARRASEADSPRTTRELMRVIDVLKPWAQRPTVRELSAVLTDR